MTIVALDVERLARGAAIRGVRRHARRRDLSAPAPAEHLAQQPADDGHFPPDADEDYAQHDVSGGRIIGEQQLILLARRDRVEQSGINRRAEQPTHHSAKENTQQKQKNDDAAGNGGSLGLIEILDGFPGCLPVIGRRLKIRE